MTPATTILNNVLKKNAQEGNIPLQQKNWGGLGDQSTAGPYGMSDKDVVNNRIDEVSGNDQASAAAGKAILADPVNKDLVPQAAALTRGSGHGPGVVGDYLSSLQRGHTGTVAATGAVTLLAGVLAYNLLKRKKTQGY